MDALIPPPRDDDDEDVYLALQTAKALWSRNERDDALRWLRRAAEQASDANADDRALELFKAAADVASRMQQAAQAAAPARGPGPPPPPNRKPVELAPGPPGRPPGPAPVGMTPPQPPVRPPSPGASPSATPPPPPAHASSAPPAPHPSQPPYGAGPGRASAASMPQVPVTTPPPPPVRMGPGTQRPPPAAMPQAAVPLIRPKVAPGQVPPGQPPPGRPVPQQAGPYAPPPPPGYVQPPPAPRGDEAFQARTGTIAGPGPAAQMPIYAADLEDEASDAPTTVGKLPPEFQRQHQAPQARPQPPPQGNAHAAPAQHAPHAQQAPHGQPAVGAPRKAARRRTLSRGEQSPLAPGRGGHGGPPAREPQHGGHGHRDSHGRESHARDPREGQPPARAASAPSGGPSSSPRGNAAQVDPRAGADPRRPAGRGAPLPSEVPTAPGNDPKTGSARAAALRALAIADDEVTAQRDVAVLQRLRELKEVSVDDLDEDTSVLPGLKAGVVAAAAKRAAEEDAAKRAAAAREPAPAPRQKPAYPGSVLPGAEDDRPTPTDHQDVADLSVTVPPDTSRTSTAALEATAMDASADTGRYSAVDALWVTSGGGGAPPAPVVTTTSSTPPAPSSRNRSMTVQNPAAVAEAAAADAAAAAAHAENDRRAKAAAKAAAPVAALMAFRVAVFPDGGSGPRIAPLAPGAIPPPGGTPALLVATTEAESAELARILGHRG